jgi:hypothetical protein
MGQLAANQQLAATLYAAVDGGGGDWTDREAWPVHLGLGVTLVAPGVFFAPSGGTDAFDVYS